MSEKVRYITTPIYYVNDAPHIGHAYTTLACDVMARFWRLDGARVKFLTGTDEHGQKVDKSAAAAGMAPQAFVDKVSQNFRDLTVAMNFSQDDFIRTTEARHKRAVADLWQRLVDRGQIYLGSYSGWYAVRDEAFYSADEIVDGLAPTGAPVEWVTESSYFFKLSAWQQPLLDFYEKHPDFIAPESRRNEVISFVKGGLMDLSVSRTSFKWGIPVPNAPDHVIYVWLDALTNYISALGYPATDQDFDAFWQNSLHVVGKDILRFHAVYWPAFLMAADLPPPGRIFAHGWWTNEGQKISKSLGNVIDPNQLVQTYGLDPVRYFLIREVPFGQDGDFSRTAMLGRLNSDLANAYGNLIQRTLSFIAKNLDGRTPMPGAMTEADKDLIDAAHGLLDDVRALIDKQQLHRYPEHVWTVIGAANRYVDEQKPWALRTEDPARMETVLYTLVQTIRQVTLILQPLMPEATAKILDLLAVPADARTFKDFATAAPTPGQPLPAPYPIFQKVEA